MHQITVNEVLDAVKGCVDPEMGISIVDLGLLFNIRIDEKNNVRIDMTMTSPMCPVTSVILADAQLRVKSIPDVGEVEIDLLWDPMWNPEMMSDEIKLSI
jgi:metal-sulfur cluster biosynthetic enzyme